MNGVHDMGGIHGFSTVDTTDDAQFHADWERLVFAMDKTIRAQNIANIDEKRHAIERMPPEDYLRATYFERWLAALETNLRDKGYLTRSELDARLDGLLAADNPTIPVPDRTDPDLAAAVRESFASESSFDREPKEFRFAEGDAIRVRNIHPHGHTRCPRYARRATGEVAELHGTFVFPDANAHSEGRAEPLYAVRFDTAELWGPDAENPDDTIHIDLWEPYLEHP